VKSKVYFVAVKNSDTKEAIREKFACLLEGSNMFGFLKKNEQVAIKMHFGEEGNTGFVKPEYVRLVADKIKKTGARPVLTDTNTLYSGRRTNAKDHTLLAHEHGFTEDIAGAPVVIADGNKDVATNGKFVKIAKIAPLFSDVDAIVGVSHFKGHIMAGFGGALKNMGMGCASREGKLAQHSDVAPFVRFKNCTGCAECRKVCPADAIIITDKKSNINSAKCIGCASCIAACPYHAIDIHWEGGSGNIQEKMMEYAKAALTGKEKKSAFVNFAIKITKECDCLAKDDPRISSDVGIFASLDPVAIDKACLDSVNSACGKDIFKEVWPERDWSKQLKHAQQIGMGSLDYELIKL
jgi:hypothetical protein